MSPRHSVAPPPPPWQLEGSAVVMLHGWRRVLSLVHYESSPVGPYDELAIATLTKRGPSITHMEVTSEASLVGGREGWGYPKQLGQLNWQQYPNHIEFRAGQQRWWLRLWGPLFPVQANLWTVQRWHGRLVRAPFRMQGRGRIAWHGRQIALCIESFSFTVLPPEPVDLFGDLYRSTRREQK